MALDGSMQEKRGRRLKGTSRTPNNYQFVTPAPYQVRGKLRRESRDVKRFWIPAFAGMTFLEVVLNKNNPPIKRDGAKI